MGDVHEGVCCLPPPRRLAIPQADAHCPCLPTLVLCSRFKRFEVAESEGRQDGSGGNCKRRGRPVKHGG